MHSVCIVELHVTVNYIQILTVAQQFFCGKFMWPATVKGTTSSCKLSGAALKRKKIRLLMALFKRTLRLNRSCISRYAVSQPFSLLRSQEYALLDHFYKICISHNKNL